MTSSRPRPDLVPEGGFVASISTSSLVPPLKGGRGRGEGSTSSRQLVPLTEKEWQRQVLDLARLCGWRHAYHTFDSRRSASGFPDLVLIRERIVFAELKSESGKLSAAQSDWLAALEAADAECHVWRPSDVVDVMQTLRRRRSP